MARDSKCPKCGKRSFEVSNEKPRGFRHEICFVRCDGCGTVVGVMDRYDIEGLFNKLAEKLGVTLD